MNDWHKIAEIYGWYNFIFSWVLLLQIIGMHMYMFKQWYNMQCDLRQTDQITGNFFQKFRGEILMAIAYSFFAGYLIYEYILSPTIYLIATFVDWYSKDSAAFPDHTWFDTLCEGGLRTVLVVFSVIRTVAWPFSFQVIFIGAVH